MIVHLGSGRWAAVDEDESEVESLRCCASVAMVAKFSIPTVNLSTISPSIIVESQAGIRRG